MSTLAIIAVVVLFVLVALLAFVLCRAAALGDRQIDERER